MALVVVQAFVLQRHGGSLTIFGFGGAEPLQVLGLWFLLELSRLR